MEEKIKFTEEEIKEIISSIEAAPIDGYGSMAKNRSVYTAPYRKLVALIYAKILSSIEISLENMSLVAETVFEFSGKDFNFLLKAYKDGTDADSFPIDWFNKTPKVGDRFFGVGVTKDKRNIGFSAEVVRLNEEKNAVFKFLDFVLLGEDYPILNYTNRFTGVSLEELTAYDSATKQYTFVSGEKYSIAVEHFNIPPRVGNNFFGTATVYSTEEAKYPSIISYTAEVTGINSANDVEYKFVDVTVLHKASLDKTVDGLEKNKVDKSGDTMRGPLVFESQGGSGKVEVSDQGIWTSDNGATGTGYADGRIVNKDNTITIPLKSGTMAIAEDVVAYLDVWFNTLNYQLRITARAADTRILSQDIVDFPLESMVVGGAYNEETKKIELTLQNGNVVSFPVDELVNGLISSSEKGAPNGVASLDAEGKVPKEQLPDDIGGGASEEAIEEAIAKVHRTYTASYDYGFTVATLKSIVQDFYNGAVVHLTASGVAIRFDVEYAGTGQVTATSHYYNSENDVYQVNMLQYRYVMGADDATVIIPTGTLKTLVSDTDYATPSTAGVVRTNASFGITMGWSNENDLIRIYPADEEDIKNKTSSFKPITPKNLNKAVKESVTTNDETLTDEEKATACEWLGAENNSQPYEIIEKIVVGYSLLTEEPNDWGTNYQSYFTNTGTLREPIYTPITETAVPAWEQGKYYAFDSNTNLSVNRTAEPNGTSYAFKKVIVYGYCPSSDQNINGYITFDTDFKLANGTFYGTQNRVLNWATNNNKAYVVAKAEIVNGRISALVGSANNTYLVTPTGMDNLVFASKDFYAVQVKATKITRMYIPTLIKPNTVIYIHGVRA